jgi:hypothetical protein
MGGSFRRGGAFGVAHASTKELDAVAEVRLALTAANFRSGVDRVGVSRFRGDRMVKIGLYCCAQHHRRAGHRIAGANGFGITADKEHDSAC